MILPGRWGALWGLLLVTACSEADAPTAEQERPPNILLISIDTLRADRLGCYGYARDTSPALDRFAREAVVFRHVIAPSPWTIPSHVSLLSGLHPETHGVELPTQMPSSEVPMLAERLAEAGYYCFGITDGGWLSESRGFGRGFRGFHDTDQTFARTLEEGEAYVRHRTPRGPWFGFLHTYDVHCPYDPAEPFRSMFVSPDREELDARGRCGNPHFNEMELNAAQARYLSDLYDGGIREADTALESFLAHLEESGVLENTVVVITSDHGEEFLEHGRIGHEESVYLELLRVPLIIHAPGLAPAVVNGSVALEDVVPTLLELAGAAPAPDVDGESLVPLLTGAASPDPRAGQVSTLRWKRNLDSWTTGGAHLIVDRDTDEASLFVLSDCEYGPVGDTPEDELAAQVLTEKLDDALQRLRAARRPAGEVAPPTGEELRALQRLGYFGR